MDMTYRWFPMGTRNPFMREVKSHENNTIVFDGYFYVDAKDLPVQRIMSRFNGPVVDDEGNSHYTHLSSDHIEIIEKISGEDTSYYGEPKETGDKETGDKTTDGTGYDSDEGICFFPTEITTLKYRVLKTDLTAIERKLVMECIKEDEKTHERKKVENMINRIEGTDDAKGTRVMRKY